MLKNILLSGAARYMFPQPAYAAEADGGIAPNTTIPIPGSITAPEEELPEEMEVDVPDEGEVDVDDTTKPPPEPAAKPEKHTRRGPRRYSALTQERDEARNYAAQIEQQLQQERERANNAEKKAADSAQVAMQSYAESAETKLENARREYEQAQINGDPKLITVAAETLASAKQASDDAKAWKNAEAAKPAPAAAPAQAAAAPAQQQDAPPPSAATLGFIRDNEWFDMFQRDSQGRVLVDRASGKPLNNPQFDMDMHTEAMMAHNKAMRLISRGQVPWKAESPDYFKYISDHVATEFPDEFGDEEPAQRPAMKPARTAVAGASRATTTPTNGTGAAGGSKVKLSGLQLKSIEQNVRNGAGPKYPKGHPKQFQPMSLEDARVSFARQYVNQKKLGNITEEN